MDENTHIDCIYFFVFIKCNRASQDIDTFLILKKNWPLPKPFWIAISTYISASMWDISTFGLLIDFDLLKAVTSTDTKPEVVFSCRGRHLEKWIWRHISAVGASIWTKFGSLIQNNVHISGKWSKSKPKVDFQYGGRLFFNGSSYISAINWDMSMKFSLLTDLTSWRQRYQQIRNRK